MIGSHIVVVEDDAETREQISDSLKQDGFSVSPVASAEAETSSLYRIVTVRGAGYVFTPTVRAIEELV